MTKQEFLAMGSPWGLKAIVDEYGIELIIGYDNGQIITTEDFNSIDSIKPIIRHPSDLTKPIVQANYNDGKPFVPIVELAKMSANNDDLVWELKNDMAVCENTLYFLFQDDSLFAGWSRLTKAPIVPANQLGLFQQLIKWHFWPNIPEGEEVVYVTDEFNPYA